jgi:hypothetical protein
MEQEYTYLRDTSGKWHIVKVEANGKPASIGEPYGPFNTREEAEAYLKC